MTTSQNPSGLRSWFGRVGRALALRETTPDPVNARVFSFNRSAAGVVVTPETALKISTVWACLHYLGKTVGQLPWRVYAQVGVKKRLPMPMNPVDWLLHKRPNPEMSAYQFKSSMTIWAALYGNAIAEIEWDGRGVPLALWPIDPSRVTPKRYVDTNRLYWEVTNERGVVVSRLPHGDVFHVPGYGGGTIGMSVIDHAVESLGWARATELFSGAMFGKGANPSGVVHVKKKLSPEGLDELKKEFAQLYVGAANNANVMFLDNEIEWKEMSSKTAAGDFIPTRQHQVEEMCRWFGVPPHKVMHLLRATFSNIEHQSIEVVVDSITPWVLKFEQEADAKLFGQRSSFYAKLDINGLLRGDFKSRVEGYKGLWQMGVLSTNDIRELEDWESVGPDGDKRVAPLNMTTLEKLGEEPTAALPASASNDEEDDEEDDDEPQTNDEQRSAASDGAAA